MTLEEYITTYTDGTYDQFKAYFDEKYDPSYWMSKILVKITEDYLKEHGIKKDDEQNKKDFDSIDWDKEFEAFYLDTNTLVDTKNFTYEQKVEFWKDGVVSYFVEKYNTRRSENTLSSTEIDQFSVNRPWTLKSLHIIEVKKGMTVKDMGYMWAKHVAEDHVSGLFD